MKFARALYAGQIKPHRGGGSPQSQTNHKIRFVTERGSRNCQWPLST
jgi:hypothetical protein